MAISAATSASTPESLDPNQDDQSAERTLARALIHAASLKSQRNPEGQRRNPENLESPGAQGDPDPDADSPECARKCSSITRASVSYLL